MDSHGTAGISRETKNQRSEPNMARDPGPLLPAAWAQGPKPVLPKREREATTANIPLKGALHLLHILWDSSKPQRE